MALLQFLQWKAEIQAEINWQSVLHSARSKIKFGVCGLSCGPAMWNSLPSDLHDISDTKWLKSVLFDCDGYYCLALLDISRSDSLHITFWTWTSGGLKSRCNGLSQITSQWPWKWCLCGLLSLPWTTECCEQLVSVLLCVLGCHRHSTPAGVCNAWRRHHREECYSEDMDGWF